MKTHHRFIQPISWINIRRKVASANSELTKIIDEINPSPQNRLFLATYSYGDIIVNKGIVQLPNESGELLKITDNKTNKIMQSQLHYNSIPLFLTLEGDNEVFLENNDRIIPLNLFHAGSLLGIFESLNFIFGNTTTSKWSVSAGARSIFMLPKISDTVSLKRLKKSFHLPSTTRLKYISDHWWVFKEIVANISIKKPWKNEVLFFPKSWLNNKTPKWQKFREYLFKQGWQQAQFSIGKIEQSLLWESFAEAISRRNLKPRPYLTDQAKHILSMCSGKLPGFRPSQKNDSAAPISLLKQIFLDTYQIKNHHPTIMHASPLNTFDNKHLYYSINYPTLLDGSIYNKNTNTIMLDLKEIKLLLDTLKDFSKRHPDFQNSVIDNVNIDYFHSNTDSEIHDCKNIPIDDGDFTEKGAFSFCTTSPFLKGCIRLKKK